VQFFNFPKEQRNSEENKKNNIKPKLCIYKLISTVPDIPNNRKEPNSLHNYKWKTLIKQ
jgi:hypothetical protein